MQVFKPIFSLFDLIREESSALQVSLGVVLGAFLAVSPIVTPQFWLAFMTLCVVRINLLAALLSYLLFSALAMPFVPMFHKMGQHLLTTAPNLRRLWTGLYHWPVFPFTGFNNTVVLGSWVTFVLLCIPLFVGSFVLYRRQSAYIFLKIQQSNAGLAIRATLLFRRYAQHVSKKNARA